MDESVAEYRRRTPDLDSGAVRCTERWHVTVHGARQTERLGERLGAIIEPGAVIVLDGDLGAGKTTFVKGLARGLGLPDGIVTSPTFTLIHEYEGDVPLYHCDAYRLDAPEQFFDLGIEEYLSGDGVCVIEWGSRVRAALPEERLEVVLQRDEETTGLRQDGETTGLRRDGETTGPGGRPLTHGCGGAEHWGMTEDDLNEFRRHIDMRAFGDKAAGWLAALRTDWESGRR